MAVCGEYIKSQFPTIDDDLYQYVEGKFLAILTSKWNIARGAMPTFFCENVIETRMNFQF